MNASMRLLGLLLFTGALVLGAGTARAHPHVWITATSELVYAPDGAITGVRHAWTFDDMFSTYKDAALTLHFTLPLKTPVKPKELAVEVFDPAFFIDFKFADKDPVKLVGAPVACQMKFQRPNDGTANAQKLGEQTFLGGDNSNYGAMFANKITVECP